MKKYLLFLFIISAITTSAQVKKVNLRASGLTCAMCSKAVFKSLSDVPFVDKIQVDIQKSTYEIYFKDNKTVEFDALSKAVTDAGFSVDELIVTSNFDGIKLQKGTKVQLGNQTLQFINSNDQTLKGEKAFRLIDKKFVSAKQFKEYKLTAGKAYATGFLDGKRVYHAVL